MSPGLVDVVGIRVGHYTDPAGATGCTVVLCEDGAVGGVDVRGSAPGSLQTDALRVGTAAPAVHAVVLTGGSAFGLAAAGGVVRYLEERDRGLPAGDVKVPIVAAAVLFDLPLRGAPGEAAPGDAARVAGGRLRRHAEAGRRCAFPDASAGYAACQAASGGPVDEGCVGAGTGATAGKLLGYRYATKSGIGTWSLTSADGFTVGALAAVNAFGDVVDPTDGEVLAGTRRPLVGGFLNTARQMRGQTARVILRLASMRNTTIGVVATDAALSAAEAQTLAESGQDGLAWTIRPVHTLLDGDAVFGLATGASGRRPDQPDVLAALGAQAMAVAVLRAVRSATSLGGVPCALTLGREERICRALSRLAAR